MKDSTQITGATMVNGKPSEENALRVNHPKRQKPGRKAMREIKHLQTNEKYVVPRESIRRYIAELVQEKGSELRVSQDAVDALRTAAEAVLTQTFALAGTLSSEIAKKETVDLPHFRMAANILLREDRYSTAGAVSGALLAPL